MTHTLTTTLSSSVYDFLQRESNKRKTTKKAILEESLKLYEKKLLIEQVKEGFKDRYEEYQEINDDFSDVQFNSLKE